MEGSESEAIFESLNLNPQLFINHVLNTVDDLVDGALDFFHQEAAVLLNTDGTERAADLKKGGKYIHHRVQAALYERLNIWERYCLHHCFVVPDSFVLPDKDEPVNENAMDLDVLNDQQSDSELDMLRNKLSQVGKESAELNRELQALETQCNMSSHSATAATESLKLYDQNAHKVFEEMIKTAAELRVKMEKLIVKRIKENEQGMRERMNDSIADMSIIHCSKGLSNLNLEDLQRLLDKIKKK